MVKRCQGHAFLLRAACSFRWRRVAPMQLRRGCHSEWLRTPVWVLGCLALWHHGTMTKNWPFLEPSEQLFPTCQVRVVRFYQSWCFASRLEIDFIERAAASFWKLGIWLHVMEFYSPSSESLQDCTSMIIYVHLAKFPGQLNPEHVPWSKDVKGMLSCYVLHVPSGGAEWLQCSWGGGVIANGCVHLCESLVAWHFGTTAPWQRIDHS